MDDKNLDDEKELLVESANNNANNHNLEENRVEPESTSSNWTRQRIIVTLIRGGIVTVGLVFVFLNTLYGFVLPSGKVDCVIDYTHEHTSNINKSLNENQSLRNGLMITSGLLMDFLFLTKVGLFIHKSRFWRLIVCIALFFVVRSFAQVIFNRNILKDMDGNIQDFLQ